MLGVIMNRGLFELATSHCFADSFGILAPGISFSLSEILSHMLNHLAFVFSLKLQFCPSKQSIGIHCDLGPSTLLGLEKANESCRQFATSFANTIC